MKSKSLTKICVLVAMATIFQWNNMSHAGGRDSAGGSGVAYYFPNRPMTPENLEKVVSTDVYRATHEFIYKLNLRIDPELLVMKTNLNSSDAAIEAESNVLLDKLFLRLARFSNVFVLRLLDAKYLIKDWTPILKRTSFNLNPDFGPPLKLEDPARMKMVQIIERQSNILFKDEVYYRKMDAFNRASIKFHELAYAVSGHASSYFSQVLFAYVVSDGFSKMPFSKFEELMTNRVNLEYQNKENNPSKIKLPLGVKIIKDSKVDTSDSFYQFLEFSSRYLGGTSNPNGNSKALCGEVKDIDSENKELRFHYLSKNHNPFDSEKYSDEYVTLSLSDEEWTQYKEVDGSVDAFLKANYPEYLYPGSSSVMPFKACIYTDFFGGFSGWDYFEVRFGTFKSEFKKIIEEASIRVARIEYTRKLQEIDEQIAELQLQKKRELSKLRFKDYEKVNSIEAKYAYPLLTLNESRLTLELTMNHREASFDLNTGDSGLSKFTTIRTIGLKFTK